MVQGPPGSGKSTYALAYIEKKIILEGKRGVYLCWNRFLARHIHNELKRRNLLESCEVVRYFQFINHLLQISGSVEKFTYNTPSAQYGVALERVLTKVKSQYGMPSYDFIVIDEAQDLFSKGLEKVLVNATNHEGSISLSNFFLLYDIDQAYDKSVQETQDFLKSVSAHYRLTDNVRSQHAKGIELFVKDVWNGDYEWQKDYGSEVEVFEYNNEQSLIEAVQQIKNKYFDSGVYNFAEAILLINTLANTDILKASLNFLSTSYYELQEDVLHQPEDKLYYTTSLSFKGLERKVVFLITSDISTSLDKHETIIGASRAIAKLFVFHKA